MKQNNTELAICEGHIVMVICEVFQFYGEPINQENLLLLMEQVIKIGYIMTGADLLLFKTNCISGLYSLKFKLTPPIFLEWLKIYLSDRSEEFLNYNLKLREVKKETEISEKGKEVITELLTVLITPKQIKEVQPEKPEITQSKRLQKRIEAEFETGHLIEHGVNQIKYIAYEGKNLLKDEFIAARYENLFEKWTGEFGQSESGIGYTEFLSNEIEKYLNTENTNIF